VVAFLMVAADRKKCMERAEQQGGETSEWLDTCSPCSVWNLGEAGPLTSQCDRTPGRSIDEWLVRGPGFRWKDKGTRAFTGVDP
jgi:hypothetical protein